jgi:hypothetical protein
MTWVKGIEIKTFDKEVIKYSASGEALLTVFEEGESSREACIFQRFM